MPSQLFQPFDLGGLHLANRIVIAPMCQYSAEDGSATDWHLIHLGNLALSGAGLLIIEATAVEPEGRISPDDLGLWSDANEAALARVLDAVRRHSDMPVGIQLGHAGRKASVYSPWTGGGQRPLEDRGWQTLAPSALPMQAKDRPPLPLDSAGLKRIREAFVAEPGNVLLAADYSQIELRLAAHMADVPQLKDAFASGEDIHARTAREMFGEVTRDTRARAKTVNFAILYGISRWGLAGRLGIEADDAQAIIDTYFQRFPGIQKYIVRTLEQVGVAEAITAVIYQPPP